MFYLYSHTRLDKNEVFYIGIGTKIDKPHYNPYQRAYSTKRNKHWKSINDKTEIQIDILLESKDKDFILEKEIELIKFYGRKDLREGTLVNKTNGGELNLGRIVTEEQRKLARENQLGRKYSDETKKKLSQIRKENKNSLGYKHSTDHVEKRMQKMRKPIIQYDKEMNFIQEWESMKSASLSLGINDGHISCCCKGKRKSSGGFIWRYK